MGAGFAQALTKCRSLEKATACCHKVKALQSVVPSISPGGTADPSFGMHAFCQWLRVSHVVNVVMVAALLLEGSSWAQRDIGPTLRRFFGAYYNGRSDALISSYFKIFNMPYLKSAGPCRRMPEVEAECLR